MFVSVLTMVCSSAACSKHFVSLSNFGNFRPTTLVHLTHPFISLLILHLGTNCYIYIYAKINYYISSMFMFIRTHQVVLSEGRFKKVQNKHSEGLNDPFHKRIEMKLRALSDRFSPFTYYYHDK